MIGDHLVRIEAPHFVAGVVFQDGSVRHCAPILRYMKGWSKGRVFAYASRKGWKAELLEDKEGCSR